MEADESDPARQRRDRTEAEIFAQAAEAFERLRALDPAQREEPLAALDPVLRREVEELLAASEASLDDVLSEGRIRARANGVPWGVARESVPEEALPERIGDLRVLRRLGAGGMGVVYEAEQEAPHRRVAVKLVRPGLAMGERLKRFRLEAEALGRLKHPGIAQIHEFGTCDLGSGEQPYFVMELVEGQPLLVHAREAKLDRRARLAIVAELCDAVQHAHERGVVHRDLKPDNVLVDGEGRAKVLDFGVARVRADDVPLTTIHTAQGQIVGTLTHMAPEQLTGNPEAVGPAADTYALGVIAFQLLTGRLPHEVAGLSLTQAVRRIAEVEPPKLGRLDRSLRGDLETIVAKTLEPDPARRYVTPAALASDLRRFLASEPIAARPAGPIYRAHKFTRRHPGLVGGTSAAVLALSVGLALAWNFALDARADRRVAEAASYRHVLNSVAGSLGQPASDVERARLLEAPESLRGWEWEYLRARTADPLVVVATVPTARLAIATVDGAPLLAFEGREPGRTRLEVHDVAQERRIYSFEFPEGRGRWGLALALNDVGELTWIETDGTEATARRIQLPGGEETLTRRLEGLVGIESRDPAASHLALTSDGHRAFWKRSPEDPGILTDLDTGRVLEQQHQPGELALNQPWGDDLTLTEVATGEELLRLPRTTAHQFLSVGRLVTHSENLLLRVWDTNARPVREIFGTTKDFNIDDCALAGHRALAVVDNSGTLTEYLLDGSEAAIDLAKPGYSKPHWWPDGERLALWSSSSIRTLDTTLPRNNVVANHASYAYDLAANPSVGLVASVGWDALVSQSGGLRLLDLDSGAEVLRLGSEHWIGYWVSWLPGTNDLLVYGTHWEGERLNATGDIRRLDVVRGEVVWEVRTDWVQALACSPDGTSVAVSRNYGELVLLDAADGRERWRLKYNNGSGNERSLAWSPDGTLLAGVDRLGGSLVLIDPRSGGEVRRWPFPANDQATALAFSPDGRVFAVASVDRTVCLWDPRTGEAIGAPLVHDGPVLALAFHPDGTRLATGGRAGVVHLWNLETHEELLRLEGHTAYIHALVWIDEGRTLLSASGDGTVRRWSTRTARELGRARKEHARLMDALRPRVEAFLAGKPTPEAIDAWLETCADTPREREVARQIVMQSWPSPDTLPASR